METNIEDRNAPAFTGSNAYDSFKDGLTKREYAAIQIMAGFAANPYGAEQDADVNIPTEHIAAYAVDWADKLFDALNKPQTKK